MTEMILGQSEIREMEDVDFPQTSPLGSEEEAEIVDAFVEDRYPSDYRDDAPLPSDFEEGIEIEVAVLSSGEVYARAFDANGHGDGTGQFYLIREA